MEAPGRRWDVTNILWVSLALILVALVVNPLLGLFLISFEGPGGALTLGNYVQAFSRPRYLLGFRNSLLLSFSVACPCLLFAVPMAWGVSRTNMPGKTLIQILVLGTFVTPPFLGATSWILLAGPNAGWINRAFMGIFGVESGILNIYSFPGVVFVIAIYSFPYSFVFTKAALDLVSSEMEDAANCLGASQLGAGRDDLADGFGRGGLDFLHATSAEPSYADPERDQQTRRGYLFGPAGWTAASGLVSDLSA